MNDLYRYHNANPDEVEEEDCVCRAISACLGIHYDVARRLLSLSATVHECDELCPCCYRYLLEEVWGLRRHESGFRDTVGELAKAHPDRRVLMRVEGHLTCSIYGTVLDIWDCTEELVDCFWFA